MPDRRRKLWSAGLDRSRVTAILGEVQRRHGSVLDRWKPPQQGAVGHILGLAGPDGVPMVLKVHRDVDRAATEATALRLVADVAHLPAPRLVDAGPDWVLMSRFLGRRGPTVGTSSTRHRISSLPLGSGQPSHVPTRLARAPTRTARSGRRTNQERRRGEPASTDERRRSCRISLTAAQPTGSSVGSRLG